MMHHIAPRCTITLHNAPFMSSNLYIPKTCQHCGNLFTARTTVTKYCSDSCAKKAYKARKRKEKVDAALQETKANQEAQDSVTVSTDSLSNKDFLSITDASKLIGVSRWTIQRMIKRGQLKAVPFGRKHIVARHQIENLFN
jgi:excisionase family DNA binding protein|tara:strand:+ start:27654 stop:28076 length:423 start_codon:yes stop_codon:yes gene_type:complete